MAITTATQAATLLNQTMSKLGYEYQIDTTTGDTIEEGFKSVGGFPESMKNDILNMQMKILRDNFFTSMFTESKNPMRRFWRNAVDYGGGIQDVFVKLIEPEVGYWSSDFDGTNDDTLAMNIAKDLVSYKEADVINKIHVVTDKFRIKMSISDLEYSKIFTPTGYGSFIDAKYTNLQQSAEAKLQDIAINVAKKMVTTADVKVLEGFEANTTDGVTSIVEAINTASEGMSTLTAMYNYDEVRTTSNEDDLYLIITPELHNRLKSRGYSNAYNLEEYRIKNRLIILPAGETLGTSENGRQIGAMLLDYKAITIAIRYWEVMPFIVSNTDYRNTFLKAQLITGYTEFFNALAFETGEVGNFTDGVVDIFIAGDPSVGSGTMNVNARYEDGGREPISIKSGGRFAYAVATVEKGRLVRLESPNTAEAFVLSVNGITTFTGTSATEYVVFPAVDNITVQVVTA